MRFGTWMARMNPSMQRVKVRFDDDGFISLDLRKIDHQPIFLDGSVTFESEERRLLRCLVPRGGTAIDVGFGLGRGKHQERHHRKEPQPPQSEKCSPAAHALTSVEV